MDSLFKSKILQADDLKTRESKSPNHELENSSIKNISKFFGLTLEKGLQGFVETLIKATDSEFAGISLSEIEITQAGKQSHNISEILLIPIFLSENQAGNFWVGRNNPSHKYDSEDLRILQSLGEVAIPFIQLHFDVHLERDNLERVFNSTPSGSAIWRGEDLIFDKVNEVYQSYFPGMVLEGRLFEEALPPRIVRDYPELFRNVLRTGEPFSIQEQYTPVQDVEGGPLVDHYYNVNFVQLKNRDGSAYGVYQHTVDVTLQVEARKKLEAETNKLEAVFNDSPAALAMFKGREAVFEKVNYHWTQLVGPREYIGRTNREVYPELLTSGLNEAIEHVFDTGEPYRGKEREYVIDIEDGKTETRFYDFTFVRVLDGEGKPYGVFCHANNVTESKKMNELLKSTLKTRDVFMSIASHELNTPITSLKLQTQLRKKLMLKESFEGFTNEQNLKFLDHNLSQIQRLSLLVNDMLDIGRINSGQLTMHKIGNNLTELLRDTIERFEPHIESVGGNLVSHLQENVELELDPLRIDQVMTNLLTNAIKYAGNRTVTITLKAENCFAIVSVKDKGEGISKENQSRIFERFERATNEMNISGMGLGLYISKEIITAHGGEIGVNSEKGQGAEFYFKLPL